MVKMAETPQVPPYLCWKDEEDLTEQVRRNAAANGDGNIEVTFSAQFRLFGRPPAHKAEHILATYSHGHFNVFFVPVPVP